MARWLGVAVLVGLVGCAGEVEEPTPADELARAEGADGADGEERPTLADAPPDLRYAYLRARQAEGADDPRFHVTAEAGALVARSPERRVSARYLGRAIELQADGGGRGSLSTEGFRCDTRRVAVGGAFAASEQPHRVEARRADGALAVTEWVESGPMGIEQGFDVQGECDELSIELRAEGFDVELAGQDVRLVGEGGALRYAQLFAVDARGAALPARMEVEGDRIALRIEARGASWPVTVDPLVYTEEQVVGPDSGLGSDGAFNDRFGNAVAVDGDLAIVGASGDDVGSAVDQGSAYVLVRSGGAWSLEAKLTASDAVEPSYFGNSVSISGDTALVGAFGDDSSRGAAYIFVRSGASWAQQAKLLAGDGTAGHFFGSSVSVSGDTALVGARGDDSYRGSAYVFVRSGASWAQQAKLLAGDGAANELFGDSVSVSGDTALVGARGDDSRRGSAYVFVRSGASWTEQSKLLASDGAANDSFGGSVSVSGDTALVGAASDDSLRGSAYVFVRSGASWTEQAKLLAGDGAADHVFGYSVSVSGDTALVGAYRGDSYRGSAYVFVRSGASWAQQAKLTAGDGTTGDYFGTSVSVSGDTALVGASSDDDVMGDSGSAYVFARGGASWAQQAKLTAGNGAAYDSFGVSVSVSGDTALVGASRDDDAGSSSGSAYVFVRSGASWTRQAKLTAGDGAANDLFGYSVSVSGDTALVGAYGDDDAGTDSGSAYVFVRSGASWAQQAKLLAGDGAANDQFGLSVSISGDTALVGAYGDDDAGSNSGSAYVFVRSGTSWAQQAKLTASDGAASDYFGLSVSVSGDTALVGAFGDDAWRGSAYVFVRIGASWTQQAKLTAGDGVANDQLGWSVSLSGDTALVGARYDDDAGTDSGSAYVFVRSGASWTQQAKLTASDGAASDYFGLSVSISGETALVGAYGDDFFRGSAYVFERSGASWTQQAKLTASDGAANDLFGTSVALDGVLTMVGAPQSAGAPPFGNLHQGAAYLGALRVPYLNGASCTTALECESGFCADGVCCNAACAGGSADCQACSVAAGAAADGTCGPTTGNACDDGLACTSTDACDAGECAGAGSPCDEATSCSEASGAFTCSACPAGTYSADGTGASACTPCAAGTWSPAGATSCAPWTACAAGTYVASAGSATSDRMCLPCSSDSYSTTANAAACVPFTVCGATEYESVPPSSTSDRVCAPLTVCTAAEYESTPPSGTSDRVCTLLTVCTAAEYESTPPSGTSDRMCTPLTVCTAAEYESTPPTPASDRICAPLTVCGGDEYESTAPTPVSDRICAPLTVCGGDEYESTAPTPVSDRVCTPLTVCTAAEYESTPPSGTSDRVCTPLTVCTAAEYESMPPTPLSDRVCTALTVCGSDEYESTPPSGTSDRVCTPLTVCTAAEYESTPPTPLSDRVCTPLTVCGGDEFEAMPPSGTSDRVCAPLTVCTAAEYESTAPTPVSDRVCTPVTTCDSDEFESMPPSGTSDRVCAPLTVCTAAEYESTAPTPVSDRVCTPLTVCGGDEFEATPPTATSDRVCAPIGACGAEQYESAPPTATSDRVCTPYTTCTADQYQSVAPTGTSDRQCTPLTVCGPTEYESAPPTATSDRTCAPVTICDADEYEAAAPTGTTDRVCGAVTTCDADEYEAAAPTPVSDRLCALLTVCGDDEFEATPPSATSDRICAAVGTCGAEEYESAPPTATSDRVCTPYTTCTAEQYQSVAPTATSDRECTAVTVCTATEYESSAPTVTSDRVCTPVTTCGADEYELAAPTGTSDRQCTALTVCGDVEFESAPPSATSDRACSPLTVCGEEEYESAAPTATSDRECSMCSTCGEGERELSACTATEDAVCEPLGDAGVPDAGPEGDASVDRDAGVADAAVDGGGDPMSDGGCACSAPGAVPAHDAPLGLFALGALVIGATLRRRLPKR